MTSLKISLFYVMVEQMEKPSRKWGEDLKKNRVMFVKLKFKCFLLNLFGFH